MVHKFFVWLLATILTAVALPILQLPIALGMWIGWNDGGMATALHMPPVEYTTVWVMLAAIAACSAPVLVFCRMVLDNGK